MAEAENKTAIDLLLESDEAEIQQLLEHQKIGEGDASLDPEAVAAAEKEEGGTDKVEPDEAAKAAELKAAADAKAAEEEAAKQAEADRLAAEEKAAADKVVSDKTAADEKRREDNKRWQEFRRLKREAKEREEREAKEKAEAEAKKAAETSPDELDPIERAQQDAREAKEMARQAQERAERAESQARDRMAQQDADSEIVRQVNQYKQANPDYDDRERYVVEARVKQLDAMGFLDDRANEYIEQRPDLVELHARQTGRDPEDAAKIREAARDMAVKIALYQERNALVQNCRQSGRSLPEVIHKISDSIGYRPKEQPVPVTETKPQPSAQQKVQAAKEAAERQKPFAQNITNMNGNTAPGAKAVTSRSELLQMSDAEMDKLIAQKDAEDPSWFSRLED